MQASGNGHHRSLVTLGKDT